MRVIKILFRRLVFYNILSCISLIIGGILLILLNFLDGLLIYLISGLFIYFINGFFLFQKKIDKQILILNSIIGTILVSSSILLQIYYFFIIEPSSIESILLALPIFLGGFQIGYSFIIYRRNYQEQDVIEERSQIWSNNLSFLTFSTILIMGIGLFIFLITNDSILGAICLLVSIGCIIPLNILVNRYSKKISIQPNNKEITKKLVIIGQIGAFILIFLTIFLISGKFNIPSKPLLVSFLSFFETFLILRIIGKNM